MINKIDKKDTLGQIVSNFPLASEIFNKYKIDYCCGGHDNLESALIEKNLNVAGILKELNEAYEVFVQSNNEYIDWRKESPINIINHIVRTHHAYTKKELPNIDLLMMKILKAHFSHHQELLLKLHKLFGLLKIELEEHLIKEEEVLFPLIEKYSNDKSDITLAKVSEFIKETESEHDAAGDLLKEIRELTNDFSAPKDTCTTFRLVYAQIEALEKDLFTHIHLENSVLFSLVSSEK
ncbi:iron-sulfur cluster repair di-iron protein [Clostridium sp. YIM B02505]|uniref:Iron-sulfur cluster repair di-iron protein n=1 Tax=Clostridium yunnanense TaxID=2800325 RepID=A0ABS1EQZ9_9CLOT|nr:iron-sulfur cluster repair di-iron protein [Clostridium yunnanense]MBK1811823.1 iron-sulfur cluster repair di-iron protein [Clostridium yunnanense]